MTILKNPQNPPKWECESCHYYTSSKKDFNKHIKTKKHLKVTGTICIVKCSPKSPKNKKYICDCGKTYIHNSSLWNHRKKCNHKNKIDSKDIDIFMKEQTDLKNLVIEVMKNNNELQKQNLELQKQILDVCKSNISNNTIK